MSGEECTGDTDWKVFVGIGASLLSSAGSAGGLVMQKFAHTAQENLPEDSKWPECNGYICSPMWLGGFVMLVLIPLPFDLVALSMAPQSIVTALTGATIVMVQVLAPYTLGEVVTRVDWVATITIVVGCFLTTAFGTHCSEDYTLDQLLDFYEEEVFLYSETYWFSSVALAYLLIYQIIPSYWPSESETDEYNRRKWTSICYAYLAGTIAANQNIMFKGCGELCAQAMGYGRNEAFVDCPKCLFSYLFLIATISLAIIQLACLNKGLAMWKASKNLPIYNVILTIMSTLYGTIYYQEYRTMTPVGIIMFFVGLIVICCGIALLALHEEAADESDPKDEKPGTSTKVHPEIISSAPPSNALESSMVTPGAGEEAASEQTEDGTNPKVDSMNHPGTPVDKDIQLAPMPGQDANGPGTPLPALTIPPARPAFSWRTAKLEANEAITGEVGLPLSSGESTLKNPGSHPMLAPIPPRSTLPPLQR